MLLARVKTILRRRSDKEKAPNEQEKIEIYEITIDLEKHEVTAEGKKIDLTTTEFRILQLLAGKKGFVFTRDNILEYLWGEEKTVIDRTVDVHIRHLREKLGKSAHCIKNIRGIGYKMEE